MRLICPIAGRYTIKNNANKQSKDANPIMLDIETLRFLIHYGLHFAAPALLAYLLFKPQWKKAYFIMLATMLVDLDHLLATPIFDAGRCSIGFHPLHSEYAILVYALLLFPKRTRIIAVGLLWHMLTDFQDCWWI
jgi:hypothetical protein